MELYAEATSENRRQQKVWYIKKTNTTAQDTLKVAK